MDIKTISATLALLAGGVTLQACDKKPATEVEGAKKDDASAKTEAGADKAADKSDDKAAKGEMACGEGKCGAGGCGAHKGDDKAVHADGDDKAKGDDGDDGDDDDDDDNDDADEDKS